MHDTTMLKRIQAELVDELRRMSLLRAGFQAQHFSDEADAASHMEAAYIACCRARRSVQRIHDLSGCCIFCGTMARANVSIAVRISR